MTENADKNYYRVTGKNKKRRKRNRGSSFKNQVTHTRYFTLQIKKDSKIFFSSDFREDCSLTILPFRVSRWLKMTQIGILSWFPVLYLFRQNFSPSSSRVKRQEWNLTLFWTKQTWKGSRETEVKASCSLLSSVLEKAFDTRWMLWKKKRKGVKINVLIVKYHAQNR